MGHGGIDTDFKIAQHNLFDAIIGGHSHVSYSEPNGYSAIQPVVVHSGAYLNHVGVLSLDFAENFSLHNGASALKLLNSSSYLVDISGDFVSTNGTQQKSATSVALADWLKRKRLQIDAKVNNQVPVGYVSVANQATAGRVGMVVAPNSACRYGQCMLGRFVAQIMRGSFLCQFHAEAWWSLERNVRQNVLLPVVSMREAGSIRANLERGKLFESDLHEMFPWNNKLQVIQIKGTVVRKMIEHGHSTVLTGLRTGGGSLSVSGLIYNVSRSASLNFSVGTIYVQERCRALDQCRKVMQLKSVTVIQPSVKQSNCSDTKAWRVLKADDNVFCVVTEWLFKGGDGFSFLSEAADIKIATSRIGEVNIMKG